MNSLEDAYLHVYNESINDYLVQLKLDSQKNFEDEKFKETQSSIEDETLS